MHVHKLKNLFAFSSMLNCLVPVDPIVKSPNWKCSNLNKHEQDDTPEFCGADVYVHFGRDGAIFEVILFWFILPGTIYCMSMI